MGRKKGSLGVIVIGGIVTVPVHGPHHIFFQPMGMPVRCSHLSMLLKGLDKLWDMRGRGRQGPDDQPETGQ